MCKYRLFSVLICTCIIDKCYPAIKATTDGNVMSFIFQNQQNSSAEGYTELLNSKGFFIFLM